MASSPSQRAPPFSEGILLALTPAAAYGIAFAYQAGYAGYFGYPVALSALSLKTLYLVTLALLGIGGLLWNILRFVYLLRPPLEERQRRRLEPPDPYRQAPGNRLTVVVALLCMFLPFPFLFSLTRIETLVAAGALGGFACLYAFLVLLLPLVTEREKPYREKIIKVERSEREEDPGLDLLALDALERWIGKTGVLLVIVAVVIAAYAYFFGRAAAFNREDFFVLTGEIPMVVLEFEDDKIIASPFDAESKSLSGRFVIVPLGAEPISIEKKSIGPLSPAS